MGAMESLFFARYIVLTPNKKPDIRQNEFPKRYALLSKESKYVTIIPEYAITTPINFKKVNLSLFINMGPKIITQMG
jgi:hypothetical protein